MNAIAALDWARRAALGIAGGAAIAFWAVELGWPIGGPELQRIAVRIMAVGTVVWVGCRVARRFC